MGLTVDAAGGVAGSDSESVSELEPEQVLHADDPVVQQVLELLAAGDISAEELQMLPKHVLRQLLAMSAAAGTSEAAGAGGGKQGKAVGKKSRRGSVAAPPQLPDDPWDD